MAWPQTNQRSARDRRFHRIPRRIVVDEHGFTLIEVLVATLILTAGLIALMGMLIVASKATSTNRVRQNATNLAREVGEDARTLDYSDLLPSSIASSLQPLVSGSTVSGTNLNVTRGIYSFKVTFSICSMDDPIDGYGSHTTAPHSGGSWCPDVASSGSSDSNPDDYKRVSITVTPTNGNRTTPTVQQTVLIYSQLENGPAISCLSTTSSCPGSNVTYTSGTQQQFTVKTTAAAAAIEWFVNGNKPSSSQIPTGNSDPYTTSGTSSTFTWIFPTADGTYPIAAEAFDGNGDTGTQSSLQIQLNRHQAIAPTSITAGWDHQTSAVDVQWVPSVDQDILYYNVYHYYGSTGVATLACSHVTSTSCTDSTALSPGLLSAEPSTCSSTNTSWTTSNNYYVVGVDTDPTTGLPRESTAKSTTSDANLCDHPPNAPTSLTASLSGSTVNLSWTAPSTADPDSWDKITSWRIYRWTGGTSQPTVSGRYDLIGSTNGTGASVTSYTDNSADPSGVAQNYCVTAVDTHLDESPCSNTVTK
jgi:Tfp pilus assembly protein PilV